MSDDKHDIGEVFLKNVRLSFADIYEPKEWNNADGTKRYQYAANFLLPKDNSAQARYMGKTMPALKALKMAKEAVLKNWKADFDPKKLKADRHCVRDGDQETYDGYEDMFYVSASNRDSPVVADSQTNEVSRGQKGAPYSGCYVNAIVRLWVQQPGEKNGQPIPLRVNAGLEAIQFWEDGEAFGRKRVDPTSAFEAKAGVEMGGGDDDDDDDDDSLV